MSSHAPWLAHSIQPDLLQKVIPRARHILRKYSFDAIAFRGVSGALTAPTLAYLLKKNVLAVRKIQDDGTLEDTHSSHTVEGSSNTLRYVIVDDFVSTGRTVAAILNAMRHFAPSTRCIGVLEVEGILDVNNYRSFSAHTDKEVIRRKGHLTTITEKLITRRLTAAANCYLAMDVLPTT